MKEYPVKGEKIHYIDDKEFDSILSLYIPYWKVKFIGGFAFSARKDIYIREKRRGDVKLLNHERGHLRGYSHTWLPTLMFPSYIGRLFNVYK